MMGHRFIFIVALCIVTGIIAEPPLCLEGYDRNGLTKNDPSCTPLDVYVPSQSENTFAFNCLKKLENSILKDRQATPCGEMNALASRITIVLGITLIGEPVAYGYSIAKAQIESLSYIGLLCKGCARVHVTLTHTLLPEEMESISAHEDGISDSPGKSSQEDISELVSLLDKLSGGEATHRIIDKNQWEYPALSALHEFALSESTQLQMMKDDDKKIKIIKNVQCNNSEVKSDSLYLYLHNKGATHFLDNVGPKYEPNFEKSRLNNGFGRRTLYEMAIFHEVVTPWREMVMLFDMLGDKMQHSGIAPAGGGWEWYNFWWARPSYLAARTAPSPPGYDVDRHDYEYWLGKAELLTKKQQEVKNVGKNKPPNRQVSGCKLGFSISHCEIGQCGQEKWAESRVKIARQKVDKEMKQLINSQ